MRSNISGFTGTSKGNLPRVELAAVADLKPSKNNARTHPKKQTEALAASLRQFGFNTVVAVDDEGYIAAGHARVEAAKLAGITHVPVVRLSHLSKSKIRAFMLADNKLAERAGWDREILAAEFLELQIALPSLALDLSITGFEPQEVDSVLGDFNQGTTSAQDQIPPPRSNSVSRNGDLFALGPHRLLVADARDSGAYSCLMRHETATMGFLDPPYNVAVNGHVGGRGRVKHREFACASGEMTPLQYIEFLRQTLGHCAKRTIDGGITYVCMDWRHVSEVSTAGAEVYTELKNICVWNKTTPGQGTFYRSQHELIFVFKNGHSPHINTFELGQHGRSRSNVWTYPGANTFRKGRIDDLKMHPTVKPVALIVDAIKDCSKRNTIVLDVFCGSGSTIVAAEQVGRRAFCMEIDPAYTDVAIRRWQNCTGKDAALESTGQTFEDLSEERSRLKGDRADGS